MWRRTSLILMAQLSVVALIRLRYLFRPVLAFKGTVIRRDRALHLRSISSAASYSTSTTNSTESATVRPPRVKTIHATLPTDHDICVQGWLRTVRKQKTVAFLQINDGSNLAGLQCVVNLSKAEPESKSNDNSNLRNTIDRLTTGSAVELTGRLVPSLGNQAVELKATSITLVGECDNSYPLAKKRHSLEYLRTIAHLRVRTNTLAAVARVRSQLAGAIHAFFQNKGFVYLQTPLITASDCEGAGELFRVTTLDVEQVTALPQNNSYSRDFFGKPAFLTCSGQLGAETHACALGDVYTFGPTFRAENSQTARHLAEFHMVEPEMAFCDLPQAMENVQELLQTITQHVLTHCQEDLQFFQKFYDATLLQRLQQLATESFARITYRDAIRLLQEEIAKNSTNWQYPEVKFGTDLATEHERWLAETHFCSAVFVYNYPKSIKAFYMRDNDDDHGETVLAMDLLVPGVGELVGGSQREERLDVLERKMEQLGLNKQDYWWYLDLRRYGTVPHSGYGLGFERLVTYICGMENIRDAIAFPRYPGNAEF